MEIHYIHCVFSKPYEFRQQSITPQDSVFDCIGGSNELYLLRRALERTDGPPKESDEGEPKKLKITVIYVRNTMAHPRPFGGFGNAGFR
jgi:hypothetical protein